MPGRSTFLFRSGVVSPGFSKDILFAYPEYLLDCVLGLRSKAGDSESIVRDLPVSEALVAFLQLTRD